MKCLAQAVAEKSRGQDARLQTDGRTDGREYHIPRLIANGDGGG